MSCPLATRRSYCLHYWKARSMGFEASSNATKVVTLTIAVGSFSSRLASSIHVSKGTCRVHVLACSTCYQQKWLLALRGYNIFRDNAGVMRQPERRHEGPQIRQDGFTIDELDEASTHSDRQIIRTSISCYRVDASVHSSRLAPFYIAYPAQPNAASSPIAVRSHQKYTAKPSQQRNTSSNTTFISKPLLPIRSSLTGIRCREKRRQHQSHIALTVPRIRIV